MKTHRNLLLFLLILITTACTTSAPNYGGNWKPLNTFSTGIQEIPLTRPYRYYVLPIDKTLKSLLARWASDNMSKLDYQHYLDFSLPQQAAAINTTNPIDAITKLNAIYKEKHISIRRDQDGRITVSNQPVNTAKKS